jgi:hypothetical protein
MQRPRMTIRRWMVAVAVVGTMIAAVRVRERSRRCRAVVRFHAEEGQYELAVADLPPVFSVCGADWASRTSEEKRRERESRPSPAEVRASCLCRAEYHFRLKEKFERAAWRPWEFLPDDPPDPPER